MELDAVLSIGTAAGERHARLGAYLDAAAEEDAAVSANAWIKSLRHARVDNSPFRERFTYRDDSLWWFAELYLHKDRGVLSLFRTINAVTALLDRERPLRLRLEQGDEVARVVTPQLARARGVAYEGKGAPRRAAPGWLRMDARSTGLMLAAVASPERPGRTPAARRVPLAAFVHRAFWRGGADEGSAESYVGPVLEALERRVTGGAIAYVGVGPAQNFRARQWWRRPTAPEIVPPIERLVPRAALAGSSGIWAARHAMRRAMSASADLRAAAVIRGCDSWPLIERELAGIALLQFPWSARAMDEAGAALDALQPSAALTYAEAGGWGRALALETRRRGIPLAGLQHGFIYRHWLNYLHEPDEMRPARDGSRDTGFPRPALTLLFDEYAADHLVRQGRFPREALAVTGSPKLDLLFNAYQALTDVEIDAARAAAGAAGRALILLVTKFSEVRRVLPALLDAMAAMPDAQLAIKTHPAETPDGYDVAARGRSNVRVLPASAPLAPLLRAARAVVTVNSTVALDAMALGVPALSIGLPNNLSPFVEAGAIAGAAASGIAPVLHRLLYDDVFRQQFCGASARVASSFGMMPAGRAAEAQASMILGLVRDTR